MESKSRMSQTKAMTADKPAPKKTPVRVAVSDLSRSLRDLTPTERMDLSRTLNMRFGYILADFERELDQLAKVV